ncbi:hypothetical protein ACHAXT_010460 [Thalassiosira profunda]
MAAKKDSTSDAAAAADAPPDNSAARPAKRAKKSKKEKKSKKRRRDSDDAAADAPPPSNEPPADDDKAARRAARAAKKAAKAAAKSEVLDQLPKVDGDGIPYSKLQIRRMLRRVKHGLPPIATEEEEQEIRRREKRERIEEEALYSATADDAGNAGQGGDTEGDVAIAGEDRENEPQEPEAPEAEEHSDDNEEEAVDDEPKRKYHNPPSKKTKRSKPVPPDYVCMACNNKLDDFTPHWIYDCPRKKTQKGCNQVAKKLRGLHDPPERKVFVSGLPFDCDEGLVKRYFEEGMREKFEADVGGDGGGEWGEEHDMVHCKLLKFDDSKRCKGTGFLTFGGDAGAKLALKLNGAVWKEVDEPGTASKKKKKKGAKGGEEREHKELRLKVAKVLNRRVTKMKRGKK